MAKNETTEEVVKVKLIKFIKYGDTHHKAGESIEIKKSDYDGFKKAGVIKIEEEEVQEPKEPANEPANNTQTGGTGE